MTDNRGQPLVWITLIVLLELIFRAREAGLRMRAIAAAGKASRAR